MFTYDNGEVHRCDCGSVSFILLNSPDKENGDVTCTVCKKIITDEELSQGLLDQWVKDVKRAG